MGENDFDHTDTSTMLKHYTTVGFKNIGTIAMLTNHAQLFRLERGDVLFWDGAGTGGHAICYIGDDKVVEAKGRNGIAEPDQITISNIQDRFRGSTRTWTILRYVGK
jgi:cell wall-associated NlpC family hydrolase